ncbi:MAG: hypothetical protein WDN10_02225 [bacterium]
MHSLASRKINSYFAILAITVVGSGAALIIMHVADTTSFDGYNGTDPLSTIGNLNIGETPQSDRAR